MDSRLLEALRAHLSAGFIDDTSGVSFREAAQVIGIERRAVSLSIKHVENGCADAIHLLSAAAGLCTVAPIHSRGSQEERRAFEQYAHSHSSLARGGVWIATSGSTGRPKIVPLLPEGIIAHAEAVNRHLDANESDCWLACLPLYHVGGFAILPRAVLSGSSVRLTNHSDAEQLSEIIDREPISLVSLVPTLLRRILNLRKGREFPNRLRAILLGGGPISQDLIERCPQALATYGLSEAGSMVTCVAREASADERTTAGRPIHGCAIQVVDASSNIVPSGTVGRILVRTQGMAYEYVGDPAHSAETFREGWCVTEDVGYLTSAGDLVVLGRRDRTVVSGGENIALDEIEAALVSLKSVSEAVCVGLDDAEWGQLVGVAVVLRERKSQEELSAELSERIAAHKIPKLWKTVRAVPVLASGKPDYETVKRILRES